MAFEPGGPASIDGVWHPPGSSRAVPARLADRDGILQVEDGRGQPLSSARRGEVDVSARVGAIARRVSFADGSVFETPDNDGIDAVFTPRRRKGGFIHWLEAWNPGRLAIMVVAVIVLAAAVYRYAIPALVEVAILVTPPVVPQLLSQSALASLDATVFLESELPETRQAEITAGFNQLAALAPRGVDGYTLNFRMGGAIGPNAFALPDGTLLITDELVEMADGDDDAILAVLAHEIGHVDHEHSLRQLYRAAGVTGLILLIGGDIGAGAQDVLIQGSALATLSYSRDAEREADRYSVELMHRAGRDPAAIARFFELLRDRLGDRSESDFLSTHPATPERIEEARRYAEELADRQAE